MHIQACLMKHNTIRGLNLLPLELFQIPDETAVLVVRTE